MSLLVTGLPNDTSEEVLRQYFTAQGCPPERVICLPLHEAAIMFKTHRAIRRLIRLDKSNRRIENTQVTFEENFHRLTTLYEIDGAIVDVVALHGLNGHAFQTWRYHERGIDVMWLFDLLPNSIPSSRILTFGYGANVLQNVTIGNIDTFARDFLEALYNKRRTDSEKRRPIILIGHSMGGLVIRKALMNARTEDRYMDVWDSVSRGGIVFLGTPHRGGNGVSLARILVNTLGLFVNVNSRLLEQLHPLAQDITTQTAEFRTFAIAQDFRVFSFHEDKKMFFLMPLPKWMLIVDVDSARLNESLNPKVNEVFRSASGNHITMCKFSGNNTDYETVSAPIIELYEHIARADAAPHPYSSFKDPKPKIALATFLANYKPSRVEDVSWIWVARPTRSDGKKELSQAAKDEAFAELANATERVREIEENSAIPRYRTSDGSMTKKQRRDEVTANATRKLQEIAHKYSYESGKWLVLFRKSRLERNLDRLDKIWIDIANSLITGKLSKTSAYRVDAPTTKCITSADAHFIYIYMPNVYDKSAVREVKDMLVTLESLHLVGVKPDLYSDIGLTSKHESRITSTIWTSASLE